jgi:hypothetical protein
MVQIAMDRLAPTAPNRMILRRLNNDSDHIWWHTLGRAQTVLIAAVSLWQIPKGGEELS